MTRPTSGADIRLRAAGCRLLLEKGITRLSVRETCRAAGINTGIFHYYFGSREEFLKAVMKDIYSDFMANFQASISTGDTPRARLKNALVEVGKFARTIRPAAPMLFTDVLYGNKEAFAFMKENFTAHIGLITALVSECRPSSSLKQYSVPFIIGSLVPAMIFPALISGELRRKANKMCGLSMEEIIKETLSDSGIEARAEAAVRGIGL